MGCAASSTTADNDRSNHHRNTTVNSHDHRQGGTSDTNTNTTTYNNTTTTDTTTNGGAPKLPDDNAIYGYDLYGDDDKKKKGGDETTTDTNTKTNANEMQYDDAGFYGETDKEKKEVELFNNDAGEKSGDATGNNDIKTETDVTKTEETVTVEEKKDESPPEPQPEPEPEETRPEPEPAPEPEPEPEPEPPVEETDVIPPIPPPHNEDQTAEEQTVTHSEPDAKPEGEYSQTSTGLLALFKDFRSDSSEDDSDSRPDVNGPIYEEREFGLHDAITDGTAKNLEWKRPSEISSNPVLFSDGTTRYDIGQGGAGTCWFLSTVANISENPALLKQVIPDDAYPVGTDAYDGIFHSRFWRFGKWDDVYIDDFLPIIHDTIPWGARSATDENEFWVSLLEKSFARYHGSYNSVYGGQPGDAYLALTGGVAERIDFEDNDSKPRKLFRRIRNALNSGAHVTCTVPDEFDKIKGLVGGHAYSLTGTATVNGESLLRVRNPWGNTEWTGAWSDTSHEWQGVSKTEVSLNVKDDGEFFMCLQDFMQYFDQTTICSLTPDFDQDGSADLLNYVTNVYGEWRGDSAAGFSNKLQNPRFLFTVPDSVQDAPLVVQLIQSRGNRQLDNFQVRCDLFRVLGDSGDSAVLEIMGENTNNYCPETQCSFRHRVSGGTYAIVPSTVDPGLEKTFLIRVFSSFPLSNIKELPRSYKMMSCKQDTAFAHKGQEYPLSFVKTECGAFKAGVNAGGQISHRDSHASNPQIVISVSETTPVVLHVMQEHCEPRMPIGLRLFPTGDAPLSIDDIYSMYEDALTDSDGTQSKFIQSWDVEASYMLSPGQYTLLLHMDEPDTEKIFTLVLKSSSPVDVRGHQMGV